MQTREINKCKYLYASHEDMVLTIKEWLSPLGGTGRTTLIP